MTYSAQIRFAPIKTFERIMDPRWTHPERTLYESGSLSFAPWVTEGVPLLVDHREARRIGTVHELLEVKDWRGGPWICARATVDHPPPWLRVGTNVSFGSKPFNRGNYTACELIVCAFVHEVSVLIGEEPAEPLAEVMVLERERAAPTMRVSDELPLESKQPTGRLLRRPGIGQVLAVGGVPVRYKLSSEG